LSFHKIIDTYRDFDFKAFLSSVTPRKIESVLAKDNPSDLDFLALLSEAAKDYLEPMARKARALTRRHFGNSMLIFTPLYISNICDNLCPYCSFARHRRIDRRHLSFDEIRRESVAIAQTGIRHILVLTGESRRLAGPEYLAESIRIVKNEFSTVGLEVYPLTEEEYAGCARAGADALTLYQETYDEAAYAALHKGGPKQDYLFRLDAPERACQAGMRAVTVGALMGLACSDSEVFFTGMHARYLQKNHPGVEVSVSFPRIRPLSGDFAPPCPVSDPRFVQALLAMRLFLPFAGITVSTRESRRLRDNVMPLGVTKMSAGVSTAVGGHLAAPSTAQFEIADTRSVEELKRDLVARGFQPVMHDWNFRYVGTSRMDEAALRAD